MTDTVPVTDGSRADPPRPGLLGRLGGLAFRRRGRTVLAWAAAAVVAVGLSSTLGGDFATDYSAPGSDSKQAQDLLQDRFPSQSGDPVDVVAHTDGEATDPEAQTDITALLDELRSLPHVAAVENPYETPGSISEDGRTVVARLYLDVTNPADMPIEDTEQLIAAAESAERDGLEVALGGQAIQLAEESEVGSEMIGLVAAAVILLLVFGSVVAAGLPLAMAIGGLAVSASLVGLLAALVDVPEWAPVLGMMLGIALGIDYALLMVTRFREWRAAGLEPEAATAATLDTAGRAVLVAGCTVMVSMLGLFAMGLSFMSGAAVVAMVAVLIVMAAAVTLFPALLGYLGPRIDRLRLPIGKRGPAQVTEDGHMVPPKGWVRWSGVVRRHRIPAAIVSVAGMLLLAVPFLGTYMGLPDAGNNPEDSSTRQAYDMLAEGFGDGANAPLLVVADLSQASSAQTGSGGAAVEQLHAGMQATEGVAVVSPPRLDETGETAMMTVVPTTGPQDPATEDVVHAIRDEVAPAAVGGSGAEVHVGGVTASVIDMNASIADRLGFLIGGVVLVSVLLLLVAFRSVVIAVTAAVMNLLSVAATYGVVAYFLEGGWAGELIGIDTETPMAAFLPVIMFALLFGLSMDYEVFLISRVREAWVRHRDNGRAITEGLAGTARVITAAAAIMIVVFAAFIPDDQVFIKVFGVGMATAILIDATVVRMLLVPAVMHILGRSNWWLPGALERRLPQLHVEGNADAYLKPRTERPLAGAVLQPQSQPLP
ncbi:MMPL family transporter [Phytoactinopolyspora halotolerans]|uniref:MMPL family transporter n=1 Tax=Phytoactinopolyspora halotolerans TaxID=1981512 RepID=A0A6L9SAD2_9ACTN|nr:MMPL family transporter [Phytoactinopolyspora halotolerans]NEE00920.1 MMPL family transporter [Phytoactinopolyspora halotolerans]